MGDDEGQPSLLLAGLLRTLGFGSGVKMLVSENKKLACLDYRMMMRAGREQKIEKD